MTTTLTVKVNDKIRVEGGRWPNFAVGDAPEGGRTETGREFHETPFAFLFGCAVVLDNAGGSAREYRDAVRLHADDIAAGEILLDIEGYGLHRVDFLRPMERHHLKLVRLSDGFRS